MKMAQNGFLVPDFWDALKIFWETSHQPTYFSITYTFKVLLEINQAKPPKKLEVIVGETLFQIWIFFINVKTSFTQNVAGCSSASTFLFLFFQFLLVLSVLQYRHSHSINSFRAGSSLRQEETLRFSWKERHISVSSAAAGTTINIRGRVTAAYREEDEVGPQTKGWMLSGERGELPPPPRSDLFPSPRLVWRWRRLRLRDATRVGLNDEGAAGWR